jgi:hypothetical protein
MTKSCISGCRGLETEICEKAPRCSYANGEKRQFCRLSRTFKMRKRDCTVTRKTSKNQKKQIIGQFMKNTSVKRKALFLKSKCPDAGLCMILGIDYKKIREYFDAFTNFEYVHPPIKTIGADSSNGFIKELKYERNGYVSYATLKSSKNPTADNLGYEYVVGIRLNRWIDKYPCFLATYGQYFYKDDASWEHVKDTQSVQPNVLNDSLVRSNSYYNEKANDGVKIRQMCEMSKYVAILTQHVSNAKSISDMLKNHIFVMNELLYVLYQVYLPLSALDQKFTHYDLHKNNVLLYDVGEGKYIEYVYHMRDGSKVQFKSRYVAKIIDYGRSYYYDTEPKRANSKTVHGALCINPTCNLYGKCGIKSGLGYLDPNNYTVKNGDYIVSTQRNVSHDLRLLSLVGNSVKKHFESELTVYESMMYEMFEKVVFTGSYGTEEIVASGNDTHINNVSDAELELRNIIGYALVKLDNDKHCKNNTKLYTLHVYADGKTKMRVE